MIAAAAYRNGTDMRDELREKTFRYARRSAGVVHSEILTPEGAPAWTLDSQKLWNEVEKCESRRDAQTAREFVLALPANLSREAQIELVSKWAQKELVERGMIVELSIHIPREGKNVHSHLMVTKRPLDGDKFSKKKARDWDEKSLLLEHRKTWADAVNQALQKAGLDENVDHRSLKDQGITDRMPEPKIGAEASAMKRRGVEPDPRNFQRWRAVKLWNAAQPIIKAIWSHQTGIGRTIWEKSLWLAAHMRARANDATANTWQKFVQSNPKPKTNGPKMER